MTAVLAASLFLINFAIGVVTGIVQEFQFGMNWAVYSALRGSVFGAPLAIEALLAFFLESTFLGVWIFGRGRVSHRIHLASIWLVSIGTMLSALFHPGRQRLDAASGRLQGGRQPRGHDELLGRHDQQHVDQLVPPRLHGGAGDRAPC